VSDKAIQRLRTLMLELDELTRAPVPNWLRIAACARQMSRIAARKPGQKPTPAK
jgi:hypothetical protein